MTTITRKIFRHGRSKAITLPKEFVDNINGSEVVIEYNANEVHLSSKSELDTMESDPLFAAFIQAVANDALKHPEKLHDLNVIWDKEWDELLEGVPADDDSDE